ncbi:TrbM/KikA/MpfK family conjugal transfer protein [Pseudocitrobacter faecalis]
MKHTVITAALLCALTSPAFAADGQNADPNDPCAMVLCLAGKLDGSSPAECDPMYKNFMSIKKKKGVVFTRSHRRSAAEKLSACPSADSAIVGKIISKFGRMNGW